MKMKIIQYFLLICFVFTIITSYAQNKNNTSTDNSITFKVFGPYEQCKHRIEEAVKDKGVKSVDWNVATKQLSLVYNLS